MKHTIRIIAIILMLTSTAFAGTYFDNQPLSALRVTQTNSQDGTAQVEASGAGTATVHIGDTIGQQKATIVKINKFFVIVQTEEGKTKLPVQNTAIPDGNRIVFQ